MVDMDPVYVNDNTEEMQKKYGFSTVVKGILDTREYCVVKHNQTGIMYVMIEGGNLSLVVDQNGRPMMYKN